MNYNIVLNVPAKYLGSEVNTLINKINDSEINNIKVPITANLTGNLTSPKVTTDLTSGVKNLTAQLIEIQKQKLLNDGKDKLNDLIDDVLGGNTTQTDSTSTQPNNPIKDVLGGVLGNGNTTPEEPTMIDTVSQPTNPIKDIFGGVLGNGNSTPKDSVRIDTTKPKDPIKEVFGGVFGKKKESKDTTNEKE